MSKQSNGISVTRPIDKHPTPYHYGEYREVYPVGPPHYQRMLFFDHFHLKNILSG